jgi:hypothetical protein
MAKKVSTKKNHYLGKEIIMLEMPLSMHKNQTFKKNRRLEESFT